MDDKPVSLKDKLRALPRNVWAVSLTSFFMDISSEMVVNLLPLFLANVIRPSTTVISTSAGYTPNIVILSPH